MTRRSKLYNLALLLTLPMGAACLPSGGGGGGGGGVIIEGDAGQLDSGANNTSPTTKTCSDGSVVPVAQACGCPASAADCDDGDPCTAEVFTSGGACGTCSSSVINVCGVIDGCCPQICSSDNDSDCAGCGNGRVDPGETCDGECPRERDCLEVVGSCRRVSIEGDADLCTAECVVEEITACGGEDGCCPDGCERVDDPDCANAPILHGEACTQDPEACEDQCFDQDFLEGLPEGGLCTQIGCSEGSCNNGTECVGLSGMANLPVCLRPCQSDADCRRDDLSCQGGPETGFYCI